MITPLTTIPQPAPWTPCRYIPRPVEKKLTGLPKHRIEPLHDAKHLKAHSHAVPLPPLTDYDNPAEPYVPYVFAKPTETTEWTAYPLNDPPNRCYFALVDSAGWGGGRMLNGMYFEPEPPAPLPCGDVPFVPFALLAPWSVTTELPAAKVNAVPLVTAAQRKEADLLLTIPASADCLHVEAPIVPVVLAPIAPTPCPDEHVITPRILVDGKPETVEAQARRRASCSLVHGTDQLPRKVFYHGRETAEA